MHGELVRLFHQFDQRSYGGNGREHCHFRGFGQGANRNSDGLYRIYADRSVWSSRSQPAPIFASDFRSGVEDVAHRRAEPEKNLADSRNNRRGPTRGLCTLRRRRCKDREQGQGTVSRNSVATASVRNAGPSTAFADRTRQTPLRMTAAFLLKTSEREQSD